MSYKKNSFLMCASIVACLFYGHSSFSMEIRDECASFLAKTRRKFDEKIETFDVNPNVRHLGVGSVKITVAKNRPLEDEVQKREQITDAVENFYADDLAGIVPEQKNIELDPDEDSLFNFDIFGDHSYGESIHFEGEFAKRVIGCFADADYSDGFVYAGLGAENFAPDFRFLVKLLSEGVYVRDIHLIDLEYKLHPAMLVKPMGDMLRDVLVDRLVKRVQDMEECKQQCLEVYGPQKTSERWPHGSVKTCAFSPFVKTTDRNIRLVKFAFLLSLLSKREVNVYIHKSINDYVCCLRENNLERAHISTSIFTPFCPVPKNESLLRLQPEFYKFLSEGMASGGMYGCYSTEGSSIRKISIEW